MTKDVFVSSPVDIAPDVFMASMASKAWYTRVKNTLLNLVAKMSVYDPALFMWYEHHQLIGLLACHVDDFTYCKKKQLHDHLI